MVDKIKNSQKQNYHLDGLPERPSGCRAFSVSGYCPDGELEQC